VDVLPGGHGWREALEELSPEGERHLFAFEGHVTDLPERDRNLLPHIDVRTMVGSPDRIAHKVERLGETGFAELIYTPTGPNVPRELASFASTIYGSPNRQGEQARAAGAKNLRSDLVDE